MDTFTLQLTGDSKDLHVEASRQAAALYAIYVIHRTESQEEHDRAKELLERVQELYPRKTSR